MPAETFSPWHQRDNNLVMSHQCISEETYSAGAGRDDTSIVDNEHLKCTATLPLYITITNVGLILTKLR